MSGAIAFIEGLFGLAAASGISAGQSVSQAKRDAEYRAAYGLDADTETKKMRKRVEEEWWVMCRRTRNCLGETFVDSPGRLTIRRKNWFRRHLEAKGIPYDEIVLDNCCGITAERAQMELLKNAGKKRRGWF